MKKILVLYYSRSGNTKKMAQLVAEGANGTEGVEAVVKDIESITPDEAKKWDALIIGSPTYYGDMAWQVKKFFDDSVKFHGDFSGKVGGAFSSAANVGGGNETTVLGILKAMLIHGMVIRGDHRGDHYGPVSIGAPDERAEGECLTYGANCAELVLSVS